MAGGKKLQRDDVRDAQAVVDVIRAVARHRDVRGDAASDRVVRRALEEFWDKPRATRMGHRTRPEGALWSPAALEVATKARAEDAQAYGKALAEHEAALASRAAGGPAAGKRPRAPRFAYGSPLWHTLTGEHVVPVKLQIQALYRAVESLQGSVLTDEEVVMMAGLLSTPVVVVTTAEDTRLTTELKLRDSFPGGVAWRPGENDFLRYGPDGLGLVPGTATANLEAVLAAGALEGWPADLGAPPVDVEGIQPAPGD